MLSTQRGARCLRSLRQSKLDGRRYVSGDHPSEPRVREPFVLPRVVIDLDASESPYVRRWEEMDKDAPSKQTKNSDIKKAYPNKRQEEKHAIVPKHVVSALDLWAYALGYDTKKVTQLHRNLNLTRFDSHEIYLQSLHHYSEQPPVAVSENDVSQSTRNVDLLCAALEVKQLTPELEKESPIFLVLRRRIEHGICTLVDLEHVVTSLSTTEEGCRTIRSGGKCIVEIIRLLRKSQTRKSSVAGPTAGSGEIMILLHNLTLNMKSKGFTIDSHLCNAGLYYAAKCDSIDAVKKYLQISIDNSFETNRHTVLAFLLLLRLSASTREYRAKNFKLKFSKGEILGIVTGYTSEDSPSIMERQHPSFYDLVSHPKSHFSESESGELGLFQGYIMGLGHIGWTQNLDREWLKPSATIPPYQKAITFATAYIVAQDRQKALLILANMSLRLKDTSQSYDSEHSANKTTLAVLLQVHYRYLGLSVLPSLRHRILQCDLSNPENALRDIESTLVTNFPFKKGELFRKSLRWTTILGMEGLEILKIEEQETQVIIPKYFRPVGEKIWRRS